MLPTLLFTIPIRIYLYIGQTYQKRAHQLNTQHTPTDLPNAVIEDQDLESISNSGFALLIHSTSLPPHQVQLHTCDTVCAGLGGLL